MNFKAHERNITALALHPDKQTLISGDIDGRLYVWNYLNLQRDRVLREPDKRTLGISALTFNPDGTLLACGITRSLGDGRVELRETQNWNVLSMIECAQVDDLAWSPDGSILAVAANEIRIISGTTYKETNTLRELESRNNCVTFSRAGDLLIAGGDYYDPDLAVWNAKTLEFISKIPDDDTEVNDGYLNEPYDFLCTTDDVVLLRDMRGMFEYNIKQNRLKLLLGASSTVPTMAVSTNMQYMAYETIGALESIPDWMYKHPIDQMWAQVDRATGGTVSIKELQTGKIIHKVEDIRDRVTVLQFVDNNRLLIADSEGFLTVEDF